jgi:sulfite reductase alpha subunit-like flavoprotein
LAELRILVGTMTGTAEAAAKDIQDVLAKAGHSCQIVLMDGRDASVFDDGGDKGGAYLICSSTYGSGDVPDNAQGLFTSLEERRPDLRGIVYGVIALGDRTYGDTFCQGGLRFDKLLTELGAQRAGEVLLHDASAGTMAEDVASEWVLPWVEQDLMPTLAQRV